MGAFIGPVISGSIAAHHGWKSFFWLQVALSAFGIFLVAFTFPETKYHRRNSKSSATSTPPDSSSAVFDGKDECEIEKHPSCVANTSPVQQSTALPPIGQGRPSRQQFMPFQIPDSRWKSFIIRDLWTPIKVFFNPIVLWAGLMLAGPADLLLFFNITESVVLSAPPYNFTPQNVGYTNFAFLIGGLLGLATAGPYSDWIAARATRRNNNIREPEMRLPALIPFMIVTMLSLILGGAGYQYQWGWGHIVVWGYGFAGFSVTTIPTISIAYAVDSYKPISGEIMTVATVCKNFIAFSYSYWVFDLAHTSKDGWITPAMAIFACVVGPALFAIPLYYGVGKKIRVWTRNSDVHRMEDDI